LVSIPVGHISGYAVKQLCRDYLVGHVEAHRKSKGAVEVKRMFDSLLGSNNDLPTSAITRGQLLGHFHISSIDNFTAGAREL
jgi:hypothetical protein